MNKRDLDEIDSLLRRSQRIAIVPHRNPDGDAMGSCLGLYHFLRNIGHNPIVVSPNEIPENLSWLPLTEYVRSFERDPGGSTDILEESSIIFTLDFNALHRTGDMEHVLARMNQATFIMIDHHQKPDSYAKYTYSDPSIGSTCEMVFNFIENLGRKNLIDKTVATCLYTGIVTDSGSFRFPTTTSRTHEIVAELIGYGVENGQVHQNLFDNNSYNSLQLLGKALRNLKIVQGRKTSYTSLSQEELDSFHYKKGDTEGIVNYGLSLKGIVFTALFTENREENIIRISFRSKGSFDVNQFAREHFNGGGHVNAAGGKSFTSLEETIRKFEGLVSQLSI